ncbi:MULTISPECIES: ribbon-helix-helix domain-containing protein [unclassified Sagittula]|jgi:predicted DNA-binding ribbon-helix-helix protein|uniref:ribbon-helix-helix domain-containing protein n=1 Tax=unclassified Sagittula TaxID=2624628 RepID=UPI0024C4000A|nr:ribbon-helix-helix domain-containing protein [Sagittula sp. MA-2]WHZ36592.1 ribbon-helix-helix domain-containing protein [Sagittula sp. MA-2]
MCQVFAGQDPARYTSTTRRLRLNGQSTSIRLENAFWDILDQIAEADDMSTPAFVSRLHSEVLETRGEPVNFTSLLRTACLVFVGQSGKTAHHDRTAPMAAE